MNTREKLNSPERERQLKIGVDIDQTINDSFTRFLQMFNHMFGINIPFSDIKSFSFINELIAKHSPHLSFEEQRFLFHHMELAVYNLTKPLPNAPEILNYLTQKHFIYYLSSRDTNMFYHLTVNWLIQHRLLFPNTEIILRPTGEDIIVFKKQKVNSLGIDLLIDDHGEVALSVDVPVILFDCPWNRNTEDEGRIVKISSWNEVPKALEELRLKRLV